MIAWIRWNWMLDGWIVAVAVLCAVACALVGNFLVLRRMSMLGDAITHAVLPGLAVAFLISHSRSSVAMFLGAVIVGILTAFFTEWIRSVGKVDEGASMGVVFTSLFALGIVLIVQASDKVDLDAGCVLYGSIELTPLDTVDVGLFSSEPRGEGLKAGPIDSDTVDGKLLLPEEKGGGGRKVEPFAADPVDQGGLAIPRAALTLGAVTLVNVLFVVLLYKELKISSFDAALATTSGFNAALIHYLLMVLVAVTAVASFESVGSVLVVAMLIVPPATAYLLTDRLIVMLPLSVLIAVIAAVSGHLSALIVPGWFGYRSTTTAGMMAVSAGLLLTLAAIFAPRHGILVKSVRRRLLGLRILADDVVALLYRMQERGDAGSSEPQLRDLLLCNRWSLALVLRWLRRRNEITVEGQTVSLAAAGAVRAQNLVRSHRLWEQYLQDYAGVSKDRVHPQAERFEHFTDNQMRELLDQETDAPTVDPHGSPIPQEEPES